MNELEEETAKIDKSKLALLYVSLASMSMVFAGLTSAYILRKGEGNWMQFVVPFQFYISTAVLLISSVTVNLALSSVKKGDNARAKNLFLLTVFLGLVFGVFQFLGWRTLLYSGVYFSGKSSNASGSFFYVITWLHFAHYLGGIIALLFGSMHSRNSKYSPARYTGAKMIAAYWHFLDALWLYIFLFLLFY